jgi:formate-dependent nitrite reductase membrane component NrfD
MPDQIAAHDPDEKPLRPADAHDTIKGHGGWDGPTYYGRSQLKQAPFNNWVVGGYVFLAGLSGSACLLSAIADLTRGREAERLVRRGRYLSLLAPTIGSALLVYDLHTPKRFYNMLRIAKRTSPMSIGTWVLMSFSGFAMVSAAAQFASDRWPRLRWPRFLARAAHVPAAVAGVGLSTYTSSLLSATSTPLWAAAPRAQAARFGASSVVTGAVALALGERSRTLRRSMDSVALAALLAEYAAAEASHATYARTGVAGALQGVWGQVERLGATGLGNLAPIGLLAASKTLARRERGGLSTGAALAALVGGLLLRVSIMEAGDVSASDPSISFRFSQPENLPKPPGR